MKVNEASTKTIDLIKKELANIPIEYRKPFNSIHEGYSVLLEEVRELEKEVFFGQKECKQLVKGTSIDANTFHKEKMRTECIQVAAMAIRFIQELT